MLESVSVVLGVVTAYWITFGTKDMAGEISFRLPLGLQMIPSTFVGAGIHFFPYSPRWLALVHRREDCLASLAKLRRLPSTDHRVQAEYEGIITEIEFQRVILEKRHPGAKGVKLEILSWLELFSRKNWHRTTVGAGVMFLQQFLGINAFIYYAPTLFESIGQSPEMSLILSGIFNVLQLIAVIGCFFLIDNVGRRPLAIAGAFGTASCYIVIAVLAGLYSDNWGAHTSAGWACVAMAFVFIILFGLSYAPLGWAIPPEVYTNATRSKGVALSTCVNWLGNFTVGIATPPMMASLRFGTYIFFAFWGLVAGVWAITLLPETRGKTLEQIDELFGSVSGQEEREVMREVAIANHGV